MFISEKQSHERGNPGFGTRLLFLLSLCGYLFIGYGLSRQNFLQYISVYLLLFAAYIQLLKQVWIGLPDYKNMVGMSADSATLLLSKKHDLKIFLGIALLFRLSFLFSVPVLSDDYFRYIWDGKMWTNGENPYTIIPSLRLLFSDDHDAFLMRLFAGMNSPDYFTVYPPVCQFIFGAAVQLFPGDILGSVVVMRVFCIAAEIGTIILLQKILIHFNLPKRNVLIYALNPLVIIELSGNLHFESVVIFFLLLSVYWLIQYLHLPISENVYPGRLGIGEEPHSPYRGTRAFQGIETTAEAPALNGKFFGSAICFGFAVATKLIPLLFLPFFIKRLKWKRSLMFFAITGLTVMVLFLPFINKDLITQFSTSLDLYFRKFEFNASLFYIIRWIGYEVSGYDIVKLAGPFLAMLTFIGVMTIAVKEKDVSWRRFFFSVQWSLTVYLLLATTIHPWYITPLVMCSVFTGYQYPVVWSLFIALSYSAYESKPYYENPWFIAAEYLSVAGVMVWEINSKWKPAKSI